MDQTRDPSDIKNKFMHLHILKSTQSKSHKYQKMYLSKGN